MPGMWEGAIQTMKAMDLLRLADAIKTIGLFGIVSLLYEKGSYPVLFVLFLLLFFIGIITKEKAMKEIEIEIEK